ncbi:MAG: fructosamine kinase family protein, partial [Bacteroidota bacterium]
MKGSEIIQHAEAKLTEVLGKSTYVDSTALISGGCINHSMKLETNVGSFFLKQNQAGPSDLFLREAESLTTLRKAAIRLKIPEVYVATTIDTDQSGILILEFLTIESSNASFEEQLGQGLAELHQVTRNDYGFYHDNYCGATLQNNQWSNDWAHFFGQQRIWHLINLIENRRGISSHDKSIYEQLLIRLPTLIGHNPAPSLNHGDLWSGNCLFTTNGPSLIDPASYFADREFDLALMAMFGGFSRRVWDAYQETYPLANDWRERVSLYQLYHYLNHYYLFGGSYGATAISIAK